MLGIISSIVQSPLGGFELRLFIAFLMQFWGNFKFPQGLKPGGSGWAHKPQAGLTISHNML